MVTDTEDMPALAPLEEFSSYLPLRVAVLTRLKTAILDGSLKPGLLLSENKIAAQLSVSRTPVREALRTLEQERLVTTLPGRKVIVSIPTAQDIDEIYDIRLMVESEALRRITPDRTDLIERLEGNIARFEQVLASGDLHELTQLNTAFHSTIVSALNNHHLRRFLESVYDSIARLRLYSLEKEGWAEQGGAEHAQMVALLKAGQRDAAIQVLRAHLRAAQDILKNRFKAS